MVVVLRDGCACKAHGAVRSRMGRPSQSRLAALSLCEEIPGWQARAARRHALLIQAIDPGLRAGTQRASSARRALGRSARRGDR
eukprot:366166-Chlamydomonas_euryale.AAC.1